MLDRDDAPAITAEAQRRRKEVTGGENDTVRSGPADRGRERSGMPQRGPPAVESEHDEWNLCLNQPSSQRLIVADENNPSIDVRGSHDSRQGSRIRLSTSELTGPEDKGNPRACVVGGNAHPGATSVCSACAIRRVLSHA